MYKYAQLKRFHHDCLLQILMHAFMYVDTQTMPEDDHLLPLKHLLGTTRKFQLQEQYQIIGWDLVTYVQKIMS